MSTVIAKNVQIGTSGTATDNFTIFQPATPDGTLRIGNGNTGITTSQVALTSAGNVGIGTSSPGHKLQVNGNIVSTDGTTTVRMVTSGGVGLVSTLTNHPLAFQTNDTERMRIDSSGNLGIGLATTGDTLLEVYGANSATAYKNSASGTGSSDGFYVGLGKGSATDAYVYNRESANLIFGTANTERARIDSSGNLLVGKTTTATTTQGIQIAPNGEIFISRIPSDQTLRFYNASTGAQVGNILVSSAATAYNTSSDYRLKNTIAPMTGALAKVAALKPCTYKWSADGSDGEGFIAHELAEVCPQAVSGEKDAVNEDGSIKPQGIDTSFLVATLTAAIQELKAIVDAQGAEIAALKAGQNGSGTP